MVQSYPNHVVGISRMTEARYVVSGPVKVNVKITDSAVSVYKACLMLAGYRSNQRAPFALRSRLSKRSDTVPGLRKSGSNGAQPPYGFVYT